MMNFEAMVSINRVCLLPLSALCLPWIVIALEMLSRSLMTSASVDPAALNEIVLGQSILFAQT
ncbi:MAG: hypothetical protein NVS4B12_26600 [Ktedonobacteraceae bacterium]